jgi:hypothetical protein
MGTTLASDRGDLVAQITASSSKLEGTAPTVPSAAAAGDSDGSDDSLSFGEVAGIAVGVVAGVAMVVGAAILLLHRKRRTAIPPPAYREGTEKHELPRSTSTDTLNIRCKMQIT